MIQIILSAIAVYVSTSIDYLFILLILFSQTNTKKEAAKVYGGQYLGTGVLVAVSLFAAYVLNFIPQDWVIGLLGLIPLYLGVQTAVKGEEEAEEDVLERLETKEDRFIWVVTLVTLASGGDNLGIYIPYFTALSLAQILIVLIVFIIAIAVLNYVSYRLARIAFVAETLEKYERIIVPIVFIGLGIFIMVENTTIQTIFSWFL